MLVNSAKIETSIKDISKYILLWYGFIRGTDLARGPPIENPGYKVYKILDR